MFSIGLLSLIIKITLYIKHSSFPEHFVRIIKVFAKVYALLTLFLYDNYVCQLPNVCVLHNNNNNNNNNNNIKEGAQFALAVFSGTLKN